MLATYENALERANTAVAKKFEALKAAMADYENAVANALLAKSEYDAALIEEKATKAAAKFTIVVLDGKSAKIVKKQFDSFSDAYKLCEEDAYYFYNFAENTEERGLELSKTLKGKDEYDLVEVHIADYEQSGTMIELEDGSFTNLTISTTWGRPRYVIFSDIADESSFNRIPALKKYFVENIKK